MNNLNQKLFNKINGFAKSNLWWDAFGRAGAEWVIIASFGWFLASSLIVYYGYWIYGLLPLIFFSVAWICAWLISLFIGLIVRESRPQVNDPDSTNEMIKPMMRWKSFPSDHAMSAFLLFFFALIFSLPGSWALLVFALWISYGRIYVGVHYPLDILGGFCLATMVASWVYMFFSYLY